MAPRGTYTLMLDPQFCNGLGKVRRYDFIGGHLSLRVGLEVSKAYSMPSHFELIVVS